MIHIPVTIFVSMSLNFSGYLLDLSGISSTNFYVSLVNNKQVYVIKWENHKCWNLLHAFVELSDLTDISTESKY